MGIGVLVKMAAALMLYAAANYYIGLKYWLLVAPAAGRSGEVLFWALLFAAAASYFAGRLSAVYVPGWFGNQLIRGGAYWLGLLFYLVLIWLTADGLRLVFQSAGLKTAAAFLGSPFLAGAAAVAAAATVLYGSRRACQLKVRHYALEIDKEAGGGSLRIAAAADLHLGLLVGRQRLLAAVEAINRLKPDVVVLLGDIIDENIGTFIEGDMPQLLRELAAPLGVYGILGSHEYIYGHAEKAMGQLQRAGVHMLRDQGISLANGVYLIGRDDSICTRLTGTPRRSLNELLSGVNCKKPLILLDHRPVELKEGERQGIDLQLSGHTHHGQFFPLNLMMSWYFAVDWGYWRQGAFQLIVTSGYGTWGPPIRIGTTAEIVAIDIKFTG